MTVLDNVNEIQPIKHQMKHSHIMSFACCSLVLSACLTMAVVLPVHAETMVLVGPGRPAPTIVTGAAASPSEKFAAQELATCLEKITGRKISAVDVAKLPTGGPVIAIGRRQLTRDIDTSDLTCIFRDNILTNF